MKDNSNIQLFSFPLIFSKKRRSNNSKINFLLFFMLLSTFNGLYAQAKIDVDKNTIKFPKTKEGVLLKHNYIITNTGNTPLLISNYEVACPCTKLFYSKSPIPPGKTDTLTVTFDTNGKISWQDRTIKVYSNAENSPTKLRFKVMVINENRKH